MRAGVVEANLLTLNEEYKLPYVGDLVARKLAGPEKGTLPDADVDLHRREYDRLVARLREEQERSSLPEVPTGKAALSDLLVRLRLRTLGAAGE
jgi:predicted nucleotidyltransferase